MAEHGPEQNNDFMIEKIKERPINKKKLMRRTLITAAMAIIFGVIACVTFMLLQPLLSKIASREEEPKRQIITFPEDREEMLPEDMLSDKLVSEDEKSSEENQSAEDELIQLSQMVTFDSDKYLQMYQSLKNRVTEIKKSMVEVYVTESSQDFLLNVQEQSNQYTGVIIANNTQELLILTNFHILETAEMLTVRFASNVTAEAKIRGYDRETDIAVLAVKLTDLGTVFWEEQVSIATLGSSNTRNIEGVPVIALGMPMGTTDSLGYGIITSTTGQVYKVDGNYKQLQTDIFGSAYAQGFLFNVKGELLGLITDDKPKGMENVIMAYGISDLKKLLSKLSNGEKEAYFGLKGTFVTLDAHTNLNMPYGAYITEVVMNSPAMKAGIQPGDVITDMNRQTILSFNDYATVLTSLHAGDIVSFVIYRQSQNEYKAMKLEIIADEVY